MQGKSHRSELTTTRRVAAVGRPELQHLVAQYSCVHNFGAIFFDAQKHLGFAGIAGVIIKKSL